MIYARHKHDERWCAAALVGAVVITRCGNRAVVDSYELADEEPPLVDRCRECEPMALVTAGLRELAACAIEVNFDHYERIVARADELGTTPESVLTEGIERALTEEMASS